MCTCVDWDKCIQRQRLWDSVKTHVVIQPSQIPAAGKGLFTTKDFEPGEFIVYYSGSYHSPPTDNGDRVLWLAHEKWSIDAESSFCVHSMQRGDMVNQWIARKNCRYYREYRHNGAALKLVGIKATAHIKSGQELYTDYGDTYKPLSC